MLNVDLDGLPCQRYRLVDGLPEGDASTGECRYGDGIPAFRLRPEEDTLLQVSHLAFADGAHGVSSPEPGFASAARPVSVIRYF